MRRARLSEGEKNKGDRPSKQENDPTNSKTESHKRKKESLRNGVTRNDLLYYGSLAIVFVIGAMVLKRSFGDINWILPIKEATVADKGVDKNTEKSTENGAPPSVLKVDDDIKAQWQDHLKQGLGKFKVLTDDDIKYKKGGKLYLVVAGHVFDVSAAEKTYAEDTGYHGFIGRDATRAFVTGKFDSEGLIPDIDGLDNDGILGISRWIEFYLNTPKYKFIGIHKGIFFDENGKETSTMKKLQVLVRKALLAKDEEDEKEKVFPSCNMEWSATSGSRLWCSQKSGGIDREWVGVPRILKEKGKEARCVCVEDSLLSDPRLKLYKGCPPDSVECRIKE